MSILEKIISLLGILLIIALFILYCYSCYQDRPKAFYKVGECYWHIHNDFGKKIIKIEKIIKINGDIVYVGTNVNVFFELGFISYEAGEASYLDKHHQSLTHDQNCDNLNKESAKICKKDPNFKFVSGGIPCPSPETYYEKYDSGMFPTMNKEYRDKHTSKH